MKSGKAVSKHFVISLNFPCLIASLLSCLLMSFVVVVRFVVKDLCRNGFKKNFANFYLPPPLHTPSLCYFLFAPTHNSLVTQVI